MVQKAKLGWVGNDHWPISEPMFTLVLDHFGENSNSVEAVKTSQYNVNFVLYNNKYLLNRQFATEEEAVAEVVL